MSDGAEVALNQKANIYFSMERRINKTAGHAETDTAVITNATKI
jgi:hypothetical protein